VGWTKAARARRAAAAPRIGRVAVGVYAVTISFDKRCLACHRLVVLLAHLPPAAALVVWPESPGDVHIQFAAAALEDDPTIADVVDRLTDEFCVHALWWTSRWAVRSNAKRWRPRMSLTGPAA
jgi:hypothetical protein